MINTEKQPLPVLETKHLHPDEIVVEHDLNSRDSVGSVEELASSMLANGQEQPVRVRRINGNYHLVFGYRRHRAAALINERGLYDRQSWPDGFKLRAEVVECSDLEAFKANIRENAQRKDLSLVETARAMGRLSDEFGASQREIAAEFGCTQPTVGRNLRLLQAPRSILKLLSMGKTTAEAILDVLAMPEEDWEAGFALLSQEAQESGKATKSSIRERKKRQGGGESRTAAETKRLTLKQIRLFWEGVRDSRPPEGGDNTPQIVADWVVRHMDGKYGDRAMLSRLAGLRLGGRSDKRPISPE